MPRLVSATVLATATVLTTACLGANSPTVNGPAHVAAVSGSNQTADLSSPLSEPLVAQVLDAGNRPVRGATVIWSTSSGGSFSADTTTTDSLGQTSVTWTLGATPGAEGATATSPVAPNSAAQFLASTGATIVGSAAIGNSNPTSVYGVASAPRPAASPTTPSLSPTTPPAHSARGLVVVFKGDALGVPAAGLPIYRSPTVAQTATTAIRDRLDRLVAGLPVRNPRISPAILAAHLTVTDTAALPTILQTLRSDPSVASATRDVIVFLDDGPLPPGKAPITPAPRGPAAADLAAGTVIPNDGDYFAETWPANLIDLPHAWAIATGSPNVTVAVVDMGIRFDDIAVAGNLTSDGYDFVSTATLADLGYTVGDSLCAGGVISSITGDGDGPDPDPTDPDDVSYNFTQGCWVHETIGDHGLWTAGIIGAVGNDHATTAGVAWTVRLRPIRVLGITGAGTGFDIAQGILYAAGLPALGANDSVVTAPSRSDIINVSLGGYGSDPSEQAAVRAAVQAGCLIVAAAGNAATDQPEYPASYPGVLAVSSVGMDGHIASYSNAGQQIGLAAPGGEFRLDDNGGDGVVGPWWDFVHGRPVVAFGYGTSAAAPYVSGVAALVLGQHPGLSATDLTTRMEQYASRPDGAMRDDNLGWGIVNAYGALTQQHVRPARIFARLIDSTGATVRTVGADSSGQFAITQIPPGAYSVLVGQDDDGDGVIGLPGRRLGWAGGAAHPTVFTIDSGAAGIQHTSIALGLPLEAEPNDVRAVANPLSVNGYVVGSITAPDQSDMYVVHIPTGGSYTFATSGVSGACGWGIELDTFMEVANASGSFDQANDDSGDFTGPNCSSISGPIAAGTYYVTITASRGTPLADHGRYRLSVRKN